MVPVAESVYVQSVVLQVNLAENDHPFGGLRPFDQENRIKKSTGMFVDRSYFA